MAVWWCNQCSSMWGLALVRCPRCHGELDVKEGIMPKISRASGASNEGSSAPAVVRVKQVLTDREAKHLKDHIAEHGTEGKLPFGAVVERPGSEDGDLSSAGSSSEASSEKPPPSSPRSGRGSRKRAQTTESPSSEDLTESSSVPSMAGVQEADTSGTED